MNQIKDYQNDGLCFGVSFGKYHECLHCVVRGSCSRAFNKNKENCGKEKAHIGINCEENFEK